MSHISRRAFANTIALTAILYRPRNALAWVQTSSFLDLWIEGTHFGNPWYDETAEAGRWFRLHFDMTGSTLIKKTRNLGVFKDYLWWEGAGLYSPSNPFTPSRNSSSGPISHRRTSIRCSARHEALYDACGVPEASRRKVSGEAKAKILGIPARSQARRGKVRYTYVLAEANL